MYIQYLHHITGLRNLKSILEQGLLTSSTAETYARPVYKEDIEQMLFFDYIAVDTEGNITYSSTGEATSSSSLGGGVDVVLVLDYKKLYNDYADGKIDADIEIYPDLRRFNELSIPIWRQHKELSKREPIPRVPERYHLKPGREYDEVVLVFGGATKTYFPIKPYLKAIYTDAQSIPYVTELLKETGIKKSVKVYQFVNNMAHGKEVMQLCTDPTVTKEELKKYALEYDLPTSGTKTDICVRLYQMILMHLDIYI